MAARLLTREVIVMTAGQPAPRRAAAVRRTARRVAAALRAVHDEQMLMWDVSWQSSRLPPDRSGPLAWAPSLNGPRLTGDRLPVPADAGARRRP
jgi:hypothetical protein